MRWEFNTEVLRIYFFWRSELTGVPLDAKFLLGKSGDAGNDMGWSDDSLSPGGFEKI